MKKLRWIADSCGVVRSWPKTAKKGVGDNLHRVQRAFAPFDSKPLRGFREAVREIRVRTEKGYYRVIYIASFKEGIYVLHAFVKKSRETPKKEIDVIKDRLKALRKLRKG
jgi:phage-related protein